MNYTSIKSNNQQCTYRELRGMASPVSSDRADLFSRPASDVNGSGKTNYISLEPRFTIFFLQIVIVIPKPFHKKTPEKPPLPHKT